MPLPKNLKKIIYILLLCSILNVEFASAQKEYIDNFNVLDSSSWSALTSDSWSALNGSLSSTSSRTGYIFDKWNGENYISEFYFTANKTRIPNYASIGFYFYYKDSDNYGRVALRDDNRPEGFNDEINIGEKGVSFFNTRGYINSSINTSIEFYPTQMHPLKVVRLNKNIYVYYDNRLALTTQFKDENPSGKVGFDIYECTGIFRNFSLRPISMKNASGYINELNLTSANPTTRLGTYTLRLEDIESGGAVFSLSKYGKTVDTVMRSEGDTASLNFENGAEAVNFKIASIFNDSSGVMLDDVISASPDEKNGSSYNQLLILLFIGMLASLSVRIHIPVRIHIRKRNRNLPLDLVAVGCGTALFLSGLLLIQTEITSNGIILAGVGIMLILARRNDSRVDALLLRGSPINDFIGLILIFLSASYLVLFIPQWNIILIMGTLIIYHTLINLHKEGDLN